MTINSNAYYYLPKQSSIVFAHAPSSFLKKLPLHSQPGPHILKGSQPKILPSLKHTDVASQPSYLQGLNTLSRGHDIAEKIDGKF